MKIKLGEKKRALIQQLEKDTQFLAKLNIMDYSLIVGIHDRASRPIIPASNENIMVTRRSIVALLLQSWIYYMMCIHHGSII